ncbi:MAG: hypothetical protein AB7O59_01650 [Pirellulales bacterium]
MNYDVRSQTVILVAICAAFAGRVQAQDYEQPPISYSTAVPANKVSDLVDKIRNGTAGLTHEAGFGYLQSVLRELEIPASSQVLVFSKTSLQRHRISPRKPRAIYFSDNVYVGFCQAGDVLEVSAVDPNLGAVFYTIDQRSQETPQFLRQTENCLLCHSSARTEGVPGHVVRSLLVDKTGNPILSAGSYVVDHTTPLAQRWGGWYVTGKHGDQTHLGNLIATEGDAPRQVANEQSLNVMQLSDCIAVGDYLTPHSDIVALMVLEHQIMVQNRLARASYATRQALHYQAELNRSLGEPVGHALESTRRRIESAGDDLVEALLMVGEARITAQIAGTSSFAGDFAKAGPRDSRGRSLRDLDLQRRLLRYPCSYLIYSAAFDALPIEMRNYVWQRLWNVLIAEHDADEFAHLTGPDRQAIVEIIRETKPVLPDYWKATDTSR